MSLRRLLVLVAVIGLVATCVPFFAYLTVFDGAVTAEHQRWGTFGDFVGGAVGPTLGFLTLIAVLVTIAIQTEELKLSRLEMQRSVGVAAKQVKAAGKQNELLRAQNKLALTRDELQLIVALAEKVTALQSQRHESAVLLSQRRGLGDSHVQHAAQRARDQASRDIKHLLEVAAERVIGTAIADPEQSLANLRVFSALSPDAVGQDFADVFLRRVSEARSALMLVLDNELDGWIERSKAIVEGKSTT